MSPERLREMMSTGSPGLTDFAITCALSTLMVEGSPAKRKRSPYAIPRITEGLPQPQRDAIIERAMVLVRKGQA